MLSAVPLLHKVTGGVLPTWCQHKVGGVLNVICCGDCVCVSRCAAGWDVYGLGGSILTLYLFPPVSYSSSFSPRCSLHRSVFRLPSSCMLVRPSGIRPIF